MPSKNGLKLINYWTEGPTVDSYQDLCRRLGYFPSRMLWVLITMFIEGKIDPNEVAERYSNRSGIIKSRRVERLNDARRTRSESN